MGGHAKQQLVGGMVPLWTSFQRRNEGKGYLSSTEHSSSLVRGKCSPWRAVAGFGFPVASGTVRASCFIFLQVQGKGGKGEKGQKRKSKTKQAMGTNRANQTAPAGPETLTHERHPRTLSQHGTVYIVQ